MPPLSRVQIILIGVVLAVAVMFAIPAMRDSNLERWLRGECTMKGGGMRTHFSCPAQQRSPDAAR